MKFETFTRWDSLQGLKLSTNLQRKETSKAFKFTNNQYLICLSVSFHIGCLAVAIFTIMFES